MPDELHHEAAEHGKASTDTGPVERSW